MTVPLGSLESKQGNGLVIYSSHYTFSAFQKALEKGPVVARSNCKQVPDSSDTLFLNTARLFPLALAEKPTPGLFRKVQTGGRVPLKAKHEGPVVSGEIIKGNQYIYGIQT